MAAVRWNDSLKLGIASIDADHEYLFELLDQLYGVLLNGQGLLVGNSILLDLVRCTETHFRREDALMQQIAFLELASHKADHDKLLAQIRELQLKVSRGEIALTYSVLQFLTDWLVRHIETRDRDLCVAMADSGQFGHG